MSPFSFTNQQKIRRVMSRMTLMWSWPSASLGASFGKRTFFSALKYQLALSRFPLRLRALATLR